jgi:hypothetical protein
VAIFVVKVGFGRRRHGMAVPEVGPCTPPYLAHDVRTRYVTVSVPEDDPMEAELLAFEIASALTHDADQQVKSTEAMPNPIMVGADMVTSLTTVEAVL